MRREEFIAAWRGRAQALGVDARPAEVTREALEVGDFARDIRSKVAVVSLGNAEEAHGPALAPDIDDRTGSVVGSRVAAHCGARYLGHAPFATDGIGSVAQRWSPAYLPPAECVDALGDFVNQLLVAFSDRVERPRPTLIVFLSGHGGNAALSVHLEVLATRLSVARCAYALALLPPPEGEMDVQHAADGEHSIAAALGPGSFSREALRAQNASLEEDDGFVRVVCANPALGGMAGFYLFGGAEFDEVRSRYPGIKSSVAKLAERRSVRADIGLGEAALDASVKGLSTWILTLARELGIELGDTLSAALDAP